MPNHEDGWAAVGQDVGAVQSILRFPVKSMLGEELTSVTVDASGVAGDRVFALLDDETGKVISVKRPKRWGRIFELSAATEDGTVVVGFPDGTRLSIDDHTLGDRLTAMFGRAVSVVSVPPENATFDEQWVPELKNGVDPYFDLETRIEDDVELIDARQFMGPNSNFFNFGTVHLITTGTTRRLTELVPSSRFDPRRFRPNLVIDTPERGFVETSWPGRTVSIGDVRLAVSFTVPRCVMTTLAQGDLPADPEVLRTISSHNSVDCLASGVLYPCAGVYADVVSEGTIEVGQPVTLD